MRTLKLAIAMALGIALVPEGAAGQLLEVTPKAGGYFQSKSVHEIEEGARTVFRKGETTFAFGANVDVGVPGSPLDLRGDLMVATGATVSEQKGVEGDTDADLVGLSASLVLRPLSFLPVVDPYLLGGGGYTSTSYSGAFKADESDFAVHAGLGTDVTLGPVNLQVEATDYISNLGGSGDTVHDVFGTVGVGFAIF